MVEVPVREDILLTATPSLQPWRRILFFTLVSLSIAGLLWLLVSALSVSGFGVVDLVLVIMFAITLPWFVIGFWNGTIGLLIMRFARDPVATVTPVAARIAGTEPITASTAILLCTRNEPPGRVIRHLTPLIDGLAAAGVGERFHAYVLSDTNDPAIAAAEASEFGGLLHAWQGRLAVTYRRREQNTGYKAGNIGDFCARWGKNHELA